MTPDTHLLDVGHLDVDSSSVLRQRLHEVIRVLGGPAARPADDSDLSDLLTAAADVLDPVDESRAWLLLAVVRGRLPFQDDVRSTTRRSELDGPAVALHAVLRRWADEETRPGARVSLEVISDQVVVDLHHTSRAEFATGIQRVTREVARRWADFADITTVGWLSDMSGIRRLSADERTTAFFGGPNVVAAPVNADVVVPWNCTYIVPELAAEVARAERLTSMAMSTGTSLSLIGYDLVPMTTAETSQDGLVPGFARNLIASRHAKVIAPISNAAADEYRGWVRMLVGTGFHGPRVEPVLLPTEVPMVDDAQVERAAARLLVGTLPLVLVVGSHEPRKNHLAVLHAAELLWREGHQFSLTFIGGNAWNSEDFHITLTALAERGRPVESISAASDDLLWGGYRVARFTIFPSLNEGFGLPLAESLACGTPAVTSRYGAMREIVDSGGGAVLVDPRDDHAVADGMRELLTDDELLARLRAQAFARPRRTWDMYASETWDLFTGA